MHVDFAQRGLGTATCGPDVLDEFNLWPGLYALRLHAGSLRRQAPAGGDVGLPLTCRQTARPGASQGAPNSRFHEKGVTCHVPTGLRQVSPPCGSSQAAEDIGRGGESLPGFIGKLTKPDSEALMRDMANFYPALAKHRGAAEALRLEEPAVRRRGAFLRVQAYQRRLAADAVRCSRSAIPPIRSCSSTRSRTASTRSWSASW